MAGKTKRRRSSASAAEEATVKARKPQTKQHAEETQRAKTASVTGRRNLRTLATPPPSSDGKSKGCQLKHGAKKLDLQEPVISRQTEKGEENDIKIDTDVEDGCEGSEGHGDRNRIVNFAALEGVGEDSESSDDDAPLETVELAQLPSQMLSEIRNDEPALNKKLSDIAIFAENEGKNHLPFWESLSVKMPLDEKLPDSLAMDDLKREQKFAELATASVHLGLEMLRKQKVKFRRPSDYFAQMVKTDVQMGKVKAKILHQKEKIESAEKRRNNREIAKNRKKVRSTQLQREQEKNRRAKEEIEAFSRLRKQRLKDRADSKNAENGDDDFPIELLDVEQLDEDNRFQAQSDIASGKRKAWTPKNDKFSKPPQSDHSQGRSRVNNRNGAYGIQRDNQKGRQPDRNRGKGVVGGTSGGVRKPRGSKKRFGRSRRKANQN